MTSRRSDGVLGAAGNRLMLWLGLIGILLFVLLPVFILLIEAVSVVLHPDPALSSPLQCLSGRHLGLLANSLLYSSIVSLMALVVGFLTASILWQWSKPPGIWLRWLILPLIVIPPYVHAEAWINSFSIVDRALGGTAASLVQLGGWPGAVFIQFMACLPITTGLALLGLTAIDPAMIDSALVSKPFGVVLRRIILPLASPHLLVGAGYVFICSLADYSVPSLFQQNIYALELFAGFSQHGSAGLTMWHSLPQVLPAVFVVWVAIGGVRDLGTGATYLTNHNASNIDWPWWFRGTQSLAIVLLVLQILVPVISLVNGAGTFDQAVSSIVAAREEIHTSLLVALISGLACLPIALALAVQICRSNKLSSILWLICFLPLAIPAPLTGIGLIHLWNQPWLDHLYSSIAMLVFANLARFTPIAILILVVYLRHLDPVLFDAARVFQSSHSQTWWRIRLPLISPGLAAAGCIVAALSLGELGTSLLVAPPGQATLTMRIYNYMHYGSSASVAGLSLFIAGVVLLLGTLATWGMYWLVLHQKQRKVDSR